MKNNSESSNSLVSRMPGPYDLSVLLNGLVQREAILKELSDKYAHSLINLKYFNLKDISGLLDLYKRLFRVHAKSKIDSLVFK